MQERQQLLLWSVFDRPSQLLERWDSVRETIEGIFQPQPPQLLFPHKQLPSLRVCWLNQPISLDGVSKPASPIANVAIGMSP
jgi:hypothetical protein